MGVNGIGERATICREGCAMSCVAMALAGNGFKLPTQETNLRHGWLQNGADITPKSLNMWLEQNEGYTCAENVSQIFPSSEITFLLL